MGTPKAAIHDEAGIQSWEVRRPPPKIRGSQSRRHAHLARGHDRQAPKYQSRPRQGDRHGSRNCGTARRRERSDGRSDTGGTEPRHDNGSLSRLPEERSGPEARAGRSESVAYPLFIRNTGVRHRDRAGRSTRNPRAAQRRRPPNPSPATAAHTLLPPVQTRREGGSAACGNVDNTPPYNRK